MKAITGILALAGLVLGAGLTSAETPGGCTKGTICRQLIENGYKTCQMNARDKWKGILAQCKAAKRAKNTTACLQAIQNGYHTTFANGALRPEVSSCPVGTTDCGTGSCCPSGYPICEPSGICCPTGFPVDCSTFCCPSDFPICGGDGLCHQPPATTTTTTTTTTTMPSSCTIPNSCMAPGEICSTSGCLGFPSGGCEAHCSTGSGFVCIGLVASYSSCTTDADCPPSDPALHNDTICIATGYDPQNPLMCSQSYPGNCAEPCP